MRQALPRLANVRASRVLSLATSVLIVAPLAWFGISLFIEVWQLLNEDAGTLFYFLGLPAFNGASLIGIAALYRKIHRYSCPRQLLLTAGMLGIYIASLLQWIVWGGLLYLGPDSRAAIGPYVEHPQALFAAIWSVTTLIGSAVFIAILRRHPQPAGDASAKIL